MIALQIKWRILTHYILNLAKKKTIVDVILYR